MFGFNYIKLSEDVSELPLHITGESGQGSKASHPVCVGTSAGK